MEMAETRVQTAETRPMVDLAPVSGDAATSLAPGGAVPAPLASPLPEDLVRTVMAETRQKSSSPQEDQVCRDAATSQTRDGAAPAPSAFRPSRTQPLDYLSVDPRYFFLGSPSSYMEGDTAMLLAANRQDAQSHREHFKRKWPPIGVMSIQRVEEVRMPDGRHYRITDYWVRPAHCEQIEYKDEETQTD